MYLSDRFFYVVITISVSILLLGFGFMFVPGVVIFLISDYFPSLILGGLHGDKIMPAGYYFSFFWPLVALGAFIASKRKITDLKKISVLGKFNFLAFSAMLIFGSVSLAAVYHMSVL